MCEIKNKAMRSLIVILLLFFIGGNYLQAQDVSFTASAPGVVEVGEQFRLSFSLNKQGEELQLPTLKGFELLAGPSMSTSMSTTIINGKMTTNSEFIYTYVLQATEEGEYTIEPATITVDGKQLKSNSLTIKVVKGSGNVQQNQQSGGRSEAQAATSIKNDDIFLRLEVSRGSLYVGESLVATLKIYTRVGVSQFGRSKFPPFDGFLAEEVKTPQNIEFRREEYNGQVYDVGVLQQTILFPQHAGTLTIAPFELECIVRQRLSRSRSFFDDFFDSNYRNVRVMTKSKPVNITVKNLPEQGKPLGFSGAVGNLTMSTSISADTLNTNDALTYKVIFKGTGNLKLIEAPKLNLPPDFEVYDPKATKDIQTTTKGTGGTVTFEYLIIPRFGGDYTIPAVETSFFNPSTGTYKQLKGQEYKIHVKKGKNDGNTTGTTAIQSFKKENVKMLGEDIRYIRTDAARLREKGVHYYGTSAYWLSFLVPFVLFVVGMYLNRQRIRANADLVRVKSKAANKMAQKRLRAAATAMRNSNSESFYEEILKAMLGYVSYKLNIAASELNRDNINGILQQRGINDDLIQSFIAVLDTCEYARYAPDSSKNEEMDKLYRSSLEVITKLDKAI